MPEMIASTVSLRTALTDRYQASAAHESMSVYLADWEDAYALLGRRIENLRQLRDARKAESEDGRWPQPPRIHPEVDYDPNDIDPFEMSKAITDPGHW